MIAVIRKNIFKTMDWIPSVDELPDAIEVECSVTEHKDERRGVEIDFDRPAAIPEDMYEDLWETIEDEIMNQYFASKTEIDLNEVPVGYGGAEWTVPNFIFKMGGTEISYGNDACPSFDMGNNLHLFVDNRIRAHREDENCCRYSLVRWDPVEETCDYDEPVKLTDDPHDIFTAIAGIRNKNREKQPNMSDTTVEVETFVKRNESLLREMLISNDDNIGLDNSSNPEYLRGQHEILDHLIRSEISHHDVLEEAQDGHLIDVLFAGTVESVDEVKERLLRFLSEGIEIKQDKVEEEQTMYSDKDFDLGESENSESEGVKA